MLRAMASLSFLNILTAVVLMYIVLSEMKLTSGEPASAQQLTIVISPGTEECFYQPVERNRTLTIDYAVIASSQGGYDVNFQLLHPNGRPLITEFRKAASIPSVSTADASGVYRFCFDNTFSHLSRKTVTFSVISSEMNPDPVDWETYNRNKLAPEGDYSMTVEEIKSAMDRVRSRLNDIQVIQDNYRVLESRDRSISETSYERVNFWSTMCIIAMITFGSLQVFVIKSLFDDKYKLLLQSYFGDKKY